MTHARAGGAEDEQVVHQLSEAEGRLVERYAGRGEVTEDRVRRTFRQVVQRFADARVRSFLPILVERAVRRELEG